MQCVFAAEHQAAILINAGNRPLLTSSRKVCLGAERDRALARMGRAMYGTMRKCGALRPSLLSDQRCRIVVGQPWMPPLEQRPERTVEGMGAGASRARMPGPTCRSFTPIRHCGKRSAMPDSRTCGSRK